MMSTTHHEETRLQTDYN
jgi:hypothetical protein